MLGDLREEVAKIMSVHTEQRQEYKDRMDHHQEDIEWVREECILLRAGLQELENVGAQFENRLTSVYQRLCQCADHQGPPISAVGLPIPPPYPTDHSLEYHTPPIEVCPINNVSTAPSSPAAILVPPPAPQSPILFSNAENIPPACCANPPAPRALLQPIEEVGSDAEDSNNMVERLEDQIGEETTFCFANESNQGRGACRRVVCALACHPESYPHCMQPGGRCPK